MSSSVPGVSPSTAEAGCQELLACGSLNYQPRGKSPRDSPLGNFNNAFFGNKSDTNTDESLYLLLPKFLKSITSGGKLRNRTTLYWSLKRTRNFSKNDFNIHHLKSLFNFNIYHFIFFLFTLSLSITSLEIFLCVFFDSSTTWDKTFFYYDPVREFIGSG